MTAPATPLDEILEKDWQKQVRDIAKQLGWKLGYHTHDSRRSDTGFPDLVLVSRERRRVLYLELKRERKHPTPSQAEWLRELHHAGAEVYLARPRNLQALATVLGSTGTAAYAEARGALLLELDPILEAA